MKIAITGGTGFIGRRLIASCIEMDDHVRVLSRKTREDAALPDSVELYSGDLVTNAESLVSFVDGVDVLFHCAGELRDESKMEALHVGGTERLLSAAEGRINHWVQLSSVGVYGPKRDGVVTEESAYNPVGVYEITKAKSDDLVVDAAERGSMSCAILRPSIVYGADMPNASLYQMISMIRKHVFFFLGKPGSSANYIHVDNVVDALLKCVVVSKRKVSIYNLSDNRTLEEFVHIIAHSINKNPPKMRIPEGFARMVARIMRVVPQWPLTTSRIDAMTNRAIYSSDKIMSELGYSHRVTMEEGLTSLTLI